MQKAICHIGVDDAAAERKTKQFFAQSKNSESSSFENRYYLFGKIEISANSTLKTNIVELVRGEALCRNTPKDQEEPFMRNGRL